MSESIRLSKYLAGLLPCSRREAENYIEGGWVLVNGQVIEEPGFRVHPPQAVTLAEGASAEDHKPATILVHQPSGCDLGVQGRSVLDWIVPGNQAPDDASGRHFVKRDLKGLEPVMPLEPGASGMVVYTQAFAIGRKLTEDSARIEQEYLVDVDGELASDGLKRLNHGLSWQGVALPPIKVSWQSETRLRFALKNPWPGLIADMCRQVGLQVSGIRRTRIGRLPMAGLPVGKWRYLLGHERF